MKTIAYITDIHLNEGLLEDLGVNSQQNWELILKDVRSRGITEIVFGGDIGAESAHRCFFDSVKNFGFKFVLGNHDTFAAAGRYFRGQNEGLGELYYAVEEEGFKQLFLDSSAGQMSEKQQQWLIAQLDTSLPVILFIHHPVLPVGTPLDAMYPLAGRDDIAGILNSSHRRINIFCGHYHMNDIRSSGNITQNVTQAASYQIVKDASDLETDASTFGYCLITLNEGNIEAHIPVTVDEIKLNK